MADDGTSKINRQNAIKYVVNPLTSKPVKVNGRTFNALVREGVFNQSLASVPEKRVKPAKSIVARATDKTQAYRMKSQLEKEKPLPQNKLYSVANDGKTIVVKNKKAPSLKPENLISMMSKASASVNSRLMRDPQWSQILSQPAESIDQHTRDQLEHMILQELVANGKPVENKKLPNNIYSPNIKEVNNGAKKSSKKTFVVSDNLSSIPVRNASANVSRARPIPIRRKPAIFSDTDQLTTDAYQTNSDEEEDEDDDTTDFD